MARKKRKNIYATVAEADARKEQLEKEIEEMKASIKAKKSELKDVISMKAEIEAAETKAKVEAAGFALLQAMEESGKTLEEAIESIKG